MPSLTAEGAELKPGIRQGGVTKVTDFLEFLVLHIVLTSQRLALWLRTGNAVSQMGQAPFGGVIQAWHSIQAKLADKESWMGSRSTSDLEPDGKSSLLRRRFFCASADFIPAGVKVNNGCEVRHILAD